MISWIQRYFQKHFRLVFAAILIAVALPMVFIYSASGGTGDSHGGGKILQRPFFGHNLGNAEETRRIFSDASWSIRLKAGYDALQGDQIQQYALQRIAGLALADQLRLPVPTADQVAKVITTLRAFQNEQGQFDQARYTQFGDSLKTRTDFTGADVNRILRDDLRLEALGKLIGGPGYVLPRDIQEQLRLADSVWTVQIATLDYATFNPALNPTEDTLKKFHADNAFRYEVPARPRLSMVEFKGADYLVAHNARFDAGFLAEPLGVPPERWICTFKCALRAWPDAPGHSNQCLRYWLGEVEPFGFKREELPSHAAASDTIVTAAIFHRLAKAEGVTFPLMVQWSQEPALFTVCNFGNKHKGKRYDEIAKSDPGYLEWMIGAKDMDEGRKFSARYWLDKREGRA
ncbi:MAG TPA: SurA N-terminal domain-containing protein, partial [Lacunisphaera sp.]|nr:SurA N-terminal domain-containing protein [Lacunisphaera sp.]